jgi:hypothetical protein
MDASQQETGPNRYARMLGLGPYQPKTDAVCFLPWTGEFGWYIMNWVKRFHGFSHPCKIACIKSGHECLFPSASHFFYDWIDSHDDTRAGVGSYSAVDELSRLVRARFGESIHFADQGETGWEEKTSLAQVSFVPEPRHAYDLKVDVVLAPRKRNVDAWRNMPPTYWAAIVAHLRSKNLRVGVCGSRETSYDLDGIDGRSWDHLDVDADIYMLRNAKMVIAQESGMAYLAYLCKCPTIVVDNYHAAVGDLHRAPEVYFRTCPTLEGTLAEVDGYFAALGKV